MPQDLTGQQNTGIEIRLLGEFFICVNGTTFSKLTANRHQALIAYLALHAPQPVQRSEVAFHLWVDSNEEQALTNLRKALHQVKHILPDAQLILSDTHTLQLNLTEDHRLDITDFKSALAAAEQARPANDLDTEQTALERAVSLYRGDVLPNFYDEWLISEREHLQDLFIGAADRLVALLEARKYYRDAIKHAQRLLQADRLREETYRTLIRLHALNDDRAAALNIYHVCASVLAKELGIEPDASTQQLHELLLKSSSSLPQVTTIVTNLAYSLVAREQEWKTLLADWKKAAGGNLHMTVLSGEAGIGKTRLAEDLVQWAARQGILAGSSAYYPDESQISYAALTAWLRSMPLKNLDKHQKREIARLIPELHDDDVQPAPMTESWQKQVFFEAMARVFASLKEPLLLFLDDLHWCDVDTLEWLRYFMRFDRKARVLILATLRTEDLSSNPSLQSLFVDLRANEQLTEIELTRLSKAHTRMLGTQLLGKILSEEDAALLFDASEGVPLFVVELAREGLKVGPLQKDQHVFLPPRLRAILEGRLLRLSTPARTVAESAAVIGREFSIHLLRKISELDEGTTMSALDELWRRRFVRIRDGEMYDFSHDKLREATLAGLSPMRASWLNQRAAEALEGNATDEIYARIADHFERAGLASKSADYYVRAANRARKIFALNDALEHITRACRLESDLASLVDLHEQRGDLLQLLEHREDAFQVFSKARELATGHLQKARLSRKLVVLSSRYTPDIARVNYQRALVELDQSKSDPGYWQEWIETQFTWIEACYWQQNAEDLDELLEQTKEPVELYGTLLQKINYRHRIISSAFIRERYYLSAEHVSIARENVALAKEANNPYQISTAIRLFAMTAMCANQLDVSELAYREAIQLCEKNNDYNSLLIGRVYISLVHRRIRHEDDVLTDTRLLEETLQKVSKYPHYEGVVKANYAWVAYLDGKTDKARQYATEALERWNSLASPYPMQWSALFVLFALALHDDKLEDALEYARALLDPPQQRLVPEMESALFSALEVDRLTKEHSLTLLKEALVKAKSAGYL